ncbi:pentapeptide repeat-containing protein [Halomonas sp. TRM85114]|uniref:pentapeptide repeat-containing protein n=1 Tax=Halomonas jincaotanensis TaxID=2810616 RepID=UPI001BD3D2F8|nr:pentapeptide repeat-containing protein [Halomonas jincaotanensis]MBS9405372.1 pentapeptide repeat-containing protein [Halomonas jincaotanensis]
MYWHEFEQTEDSEDAEYLRQAKERVLVEVNRSLLESRLEAKPSTTNIAFRKIVSHESISLCVFRVELRIDDRNQDRIHREILSSDRYQGFYLYIIDMPGKTKILDWTPGQTSEIMKDLARNRADPVECMFLTRFMTLEQHGRVGNRQIEKLFIDPEGIEALRTETLSNSSNTPFDTLLNGSVPGVDDDIDDFTTSPEKAKQSIESIKEKHLQGVKDANSTLKSIYEIIKECLDSQRKATSSFEGIMNTDNRHRRIVFTYACAIDEAITIRQYSLPSLKNAYEKEKLVDGESKIIDRYLVDSLINQSRSEVREVPGGIRILCIQKDKVNIDNSKLLDKIYQDNGIGGSGTILIANYVTGKGKIRLSEGASRSILFEDVDFHGEVVLDGANFRGSVTFRRCRFFARLSAKDTSIEGSLIIQRCILHDSGSPRFSHNEEMGARKSALLAHGLSVAKSFFITSSTIFGRVKGQWLRVGNILDLRDTRIFGNQNNVGTGTGTNQDLVKLGYARVGGPVVLTSSLDNFSGTLLRSYIGGNCLLPGLKADSLHVGGLYIAGNLDFEAARIQSTIAIEKLTLPGIPSSGWLTHIGGNLILNYAHCELLKMDDIHIRGKMILEEAEIEHSCQMDTSYESGGRCIIHDDAIFDGASIKGEISMQGAYIGGDLSLITGSFGRIYANATWVNIFTHPNHQIEILRSEVKKNIYLADCTTGSLALVGIHVGESIITNNLNIDGRIRFWGPKRKELMRDKSLKHPENNIFICKIVHRISSLKAEIQGSIDLKNSRISGGIDFSKTTTTKIMLDGSTLSGDLNFYTEDSNETSAIVVDSVSLESTKIKGKLDARGLKITNGSLEAKDATVEGSVICAELTDSERKRLTTESGNINMEGINSYSLVISDCCLGNNITSNNSKNEARTINVSRASLGQLTVYGLWKKQDFNANLNFYAAKINDWNLVEYKNNKEEENHELCFPLLAATDKYFDARNYLDIENRLHAIGKTRLSNRVYREMGVRINHENTRYKLSKQATSSTSKGHNLKHSINHLVSNEPTGIYKSRNNSSSPCQRNSILSHASHSKKVTLISLISNILFFIVTPLVTFGVYILKLLYKSVCGVYSGNFLKSIKETNFITLNALSRDSDGFLFNWIFTHGRTKPGLMFLWLFLLSLPAIIIACDHRNILAPNETVSAQGDTSHGTYRVSTIKKSDDCPVTHHVNEQDWNIFKSLGIAATYAVPFYQSAKIDKAKFRMTGCTYVWGGTITWASPHDIPQTFSMLQFALWILIAANLPAIIRHRN